MSVHGVVVAHTRIAGVAVYEGTLMVASGIVTVLADVADTPRVRVAAAAGLSHVIRLQSQVAADTVIASVSSIPG